MTLLECKELDRHRVNGRASVLAHFAERINYTDHAELRGEPHAPIRIGHDRGELVGLGLLVENLFHDGALLD